MGKIIVYAACLLLITASFALAQPPEIPPDPGSAKVPITGVEWLLFAGGLFGARKVYKIYKNR